MGRLYFFVQIILTFCTNGVPYKPIFNFYVQLKTLKHDIYVQKKSV